MGVTINKAYLRHDNSKYFETSLKLIDWFEAILFPNQEEALCTDIFREKCVFTGEREFQEVLSSFRWRKK